MLLKLKIFEDLLKQSPRQMVSVDHEEEVLVLQIAKQVGQVIQLVFKLLLVAFDAALTEHFITVVSK